MREDVDARGLPARFLALLRDARVGRLLLGCRHFDATDEWSYGERYAVSYVCRFGFCAGPDGRASGRAGLSSSARPAAISLVTPIAAFGTRNATVTAGNGNAASGSSAAIAASYGGTSATRCAGACATGGSSLTACRTATSTAVGRDGAAAASSKSGGPALFGLPAAGWQLRQA